MSDLADLLDEVVRGEPSPGLETGEELPVYVPPNEPGSDRDDDWPGDEDKWAEYMQTMGRAIRPDPAAAVPPVYLAAMRDAARLHDPAAPSEPEEMDAEEADEEEDVEDAIELVEEGIAPPEEGSLRTRAPPWLVERARIEAEMAACDAPSEAAPADDAPSEAAPPPLSDDATAKRKRGVVDASERQALMDALMEKMGGMSIANNVFARHRLITHSAPTTVTLLVAPTFALALNQTAQRLETHTFAHELDGGITVTSVTPLENSDGYNLSALPLLSHTTDLTAHLGPSPADKPDVLVAALDHLGRIKVWDVISGKLLYMDVCSIRNNAGDKIAFTEPAAFALSTTHLVVLRPETDAVTVVCVRQWADVPLLAEYGAADTEWDQFTQQIRIPQYLACCPANPFEFVLASDDGLAKINTLVPAPFRAFMPLMSWYAAVTGAETGEYDKEATEGVIATVRAYALKLVEWSNVDTRVCLGTRGTLWETDYDAGKMVPLSGPDGTNLSAAVHALVEDHATLVEALRNTPLGKVPDAFRANHVTVTKDHIVVSCDSRVVWTDIETGAHCITESCDGAIAAAPLNDGVVVVTALPAVEYVKMPTSPGTSDEHTSTDLRISSTATHEPRAVLRPILNEDGTEFVHRGAPPGTTLAITKSGHIIVHTFDEHIFVHSIIDFKVHAQDIRSVLEEATLASFDDDDEDLQRGDPSTKKAGVRWGDEDDARTFLQRTHGSSDVIDFMTGAPPPDTRTPHQAVADAAAAYTANPMDEDASTEDVIAFMTGPDGDLFE